jgi:hypothetical protein
MKTEEALRKTPVEPLALLPESRVATLTAVARAEARHRELKHMAPALVSRGVYADLAPSVYGALILSWVCFMAIPWLTFLSSATTLFMLTLIGIYAVMFFGVPIALNRIGARERWSDPGLSAFLRAKVQTASGPVSGVEALIQVILVPACLTVGAIGIAFAIEAARSTY